MHFDWAVDVAIGRTSIDSDFKGVPGGCVSRYEYLCLDCGPIFG